MIWSSGRRQSLTGWGKSSHSRSSVASPGDDATWAALFTHSGARGVTLRGLGRSYGDAALNSGGVVAFTGKNHVGVGSLSAAVRDVVLVSPGHGDVPGAAAVAGGASAAGCRRGAHIRPRTSPRPGRAFLRQTPQERRREHAEPASRPGQVAAAPRARSRSGRRLIARGHPTLRPPPPPAWWRTARAGVRPSWPR